MADLHRPKNPIRLVTASALFDGHDASINIMRRIFMSQGCEVIHLGHNRSVQEVVDAALEEDVQGVAVSSYQGGHVEYFEYLVESLRAQGAGHVRVVGGGGGVIVPREIQRLRESGVTIFSPEDGQKMGLVGMINSVVADCDVDLWSDSAVTAEQVLSGDRFAVARAVTGAEGGRLDEAMLQEIRSAAGRRVVPVLGITGTGGSGKSSLTDEVVRRFRTDQQDKLRIAVIAVDPTRRKGGGALLGDRIRANSLDGDRVFFRSLATRGAHEVPAHLADVIDVMKAAGHDLVIVETPGIGQGDAGIVPLVDHSLYVMTPEFGAASQLEKIDMLDFADTVAINKFERRGAKDALRDVGRQLVRNREAFGKQPHDMPVFGTSAATFNDDGVTALYQHLRAQLADAGLAVDEGTLPHVDVRHSSGIRQVVPADRVRYLAEITETVRGYHARTVELAEAARRLQRLEAVAAELGLDTPGSSLAGHSTTEGGGHSTDGLTALLEQARKAVPHEVADQIERWPAVVESYSGDEQVVRVRDREIHTKLTRESLSGNKIPRVSLPRFTDHGELVTLLARREPARLLPLHRGRLPVQARQRGPGAHVRRRGRPGPHQPPLQDPLRGQRRHPPVDRVRLRHPLRPRPRPAPRRLRQGRHVGRLAWRRSTT